MSGEFALCEELGAPRSDGPVVSLRKREDLLNLQQPTAHDCGPTCVLFLRLGGAACVGRPWAPRTLAETARLMVGYWRGARIKRASSVEPGTDTSQLLGLLDEFAQVGRCRLEGGKLGPTRLEHWRSRPFSLTSRAGTSSMSPEAYLDHYGAELAGTLRDLLRESPRGVACQFYLQDRAQDPPPPSTSGALGSSHWVVVVDATLERVAYYDPFYSQACGRLTLSPREFLAAHLKGWAARTVPFGETLRVPDIEPGKVTETVLLAARAGARIEAEAKLFHLDTPEIDPTEGENLTAAEPAAWTFDAAEADRLAAARAKALGRATLVFEYGPPGKYRGGASERSWASSGGAFAVVPVAETLSPAEQQRGKVEDDRADALCNALQGLPCTSLVLHLPDGTRRPLREQGVESHRHERWVGAE